MIANRYQCTDVLGSGQFGHIYKAKNVRTQEWVALKQEPNHSETKLLKNEAKIYQYLGHEPGFPRIKWFGVHGNFIYMAMDLLGPSLRSWRQVTKTIDTIILRWIGSQMLARIETLHSKGLLHRDIKPDNFLFPASFSLSSSSLPSQNQLLYLIDFGFSKRYLLADGITHIPSREKRTPLGTPDYMSVRVQQGYEPSRRDDVESMMYVLCYLWKPETDIPENWKQMLAYVRGLSFSERPDYSFLQRLLTQERI
jgi:serine/threonine protein kinase